MPARNNSLSFLLGGHGKVAQLATPLLIEAGHTVTSMIRKSEQEDRIKELGATPMLFDVETATQDDFAKAFADQDAVVWAAGAGGGNPDRTYAVDRDAAIASMDAAQDAGTKRYVMISYLGSSLDHGVAEDHSFYPYAQSKALADEHLMESELDWTILGPGALTDDEAFGMVRRLGRQTEEKLAEGESRDTSRGNVAQAIVAALGSDASIGSIVDFVDGDTRVGEVFS